MNVVTAIILGFTTGWILYGVFDDKYLKPRRTKRYLESIKEK